jgi:DNA replication protein DnaC
MKAVQEIVEEIINGQTSSGIRRFQYLPYKMDTALRIVKEIAMHFEPSFNFSEGVQSTYRKLIQYVHGDPSFDGTLEKGLMIIGPSGTGKTLAMKIMQTYRKIDDTWYLKDGKPYRMNYDIYHVNDVVSSFIDNGFDGIELYCKRYVACFDDIGSEIERVKHYGNDLDVISHILAERYAGGLLTFGTSNFPVKTLEEKYDDRTISRMYALFNFIVMKDIDYRRI